MPKFHNYLQKQLKVGDKIKIGSCNHPMPKVILVLHVQTKLKPFARCQLIGLNGLRFMVDVWRYFCWYASVFGWYKFG